MRLNRREEAKPKPRLRRRELIPTYATPSLHSVPLKVGQKVKFRTRSGHDWVTKDGMVLRIEGIVVSIKSNRVTWSKIYDKKKGLMADMA